VQVLIPAGGQGVRLRPLTNDCPKPLLPLGDRAILTHIVDRVPEEFPVTVLVSADLAGAFENWRRSLSGRRNVRIYVEKRRETGLNGPVVALADCIRDHQISDDLVILMGDSVLPFRLEQFLSAGTPGDLRLAAYRLPDPRDASRFGVLSIGAGDTVAAFEEKPANPQSPWIFTGCFHIPRSRIGLLAEVAEGSLPQMGHLVGQYLEQGHRIGVHRLTGDWHDIGTFASYLEAHRALVSSSISQSLAALGNRIEGVVYVHPGAHVAGSKLINCIVFDGAHVQNADLTNCVVQPSVRIEDRVVQGKLLSLQAEFALG
jgi:glucose-1-phosphate thymidylyltransferase